MTRQWDEHSPPHAYTRACMAHACVWTRAYIHAGRERANKSHTGCWECPCKRKLGRSSRWRGRDRAKQIHTGRRQGALHGRLQPRDRFLAPALSLRCEANGEWTRHLPLHASGRAQVLHSPPPCPSSQDVAVQAAPSPLKGAREIISLAAVPQPVAPPLSIFPSYVQSIPTCPSLHSPSTALYSTRVRLNLNAGRRSSANDPTSARVRLNAGRRSSANHPMRALRARTLTHHSAHTDTRGVRAHCLSSVAVSGALRA